MPAFTVAIPTYNRAHMVGEAIACILAQTLGDFELVISDNASTDHTSDVIEQFADKRIRYLRQPRHVSVFENWATCLDQARGEWLVFNQDDDLLCPYFLERCLQAIRQNPGVVMYAAEAVVTDDMAHHHDCRFCSLPLAHGWHQPGPRLIPGVQIAALTWFTNGFVPPAVSVLTPVYRKHWPLDARRQFEESTFTTAIACEGMVAFEGYIGAMHRQHAGQLGKTYTEAQQREGREGCWQTIGQIFADRGIDWQSALRAILPDLPLRYREQLVDQYAQLYADGWAIPREAVEILMEDFASRLGLTPSEYLEDRKAKHLEAIRIAAEAGIGTLDRLHVPRRMIRMIRGILYAFGRQYQLS